MGMSTHVIGLRKPDEKHMAKYRAVVALRDAGLALPEELAKYYDHTEPSRITIDHGLEVEIKSEKWNDDDGCREGVEIRMADIPPDIERFRFYNSW